MTNNKLTKKELFTTVLAIVKNSEIKMDNKDEIIQGLEHELELLKNKSNSRGTTKTQKENEELLPKVFEALKEFDKPITITDFMHKSNSETAKLSNQKLSYLFKKLVESGAVVKTTEKRKSYFSVVVSE